jgi:hypothetical protein
MPRTEQYPRIAELRAELAHLRARYDDGAVSTAIYKVIRELETALAWAEHREARS